jgi:tetratricopeptide (TPR) repeat protein
MVGQLTVRCLATVAIVGSSLVAQTERDPAATIATVSRLRTAGKLKEAEVLLRSALASHQNRPGDRATAALEHRLGIILQDQGELAGAEACFRQAAANVEIFFGPKHPQLAIALSDLGGVLAEEGRYREAYRLIRRAIDIAVPVLGDCDLSVVLMYNHLGLLFYRQREVARALPITRRALACLEKQAGAETIEVGQGHLNLAAIYLDDGQYSLSQEHLDRANAIFANLLPPDHPEVLLGKNTQVGLYYKWGQFKEAREVGVQLIEQVREKLGSRHPALAVTLANVGLADQKLKLYQEAAEYLQQAIAIQETINSRDPYLAELLRSYAGVLREAHRKPEAKQVELRAKTILANAFW